VTYLLRLASGLLVVTLRPLVLSPRFLVDCSAPATGSSGFSVAQKNPGRLHERELSFRARARVVYPEATDERLHRGRLNRRYSIRFQLVSGS